jgi:hypothetical protein
MTHSTALNRVLHSVGLERRHTAIDYVLPAVGLVATGMLLGTGLGMIFAPKRGAELREGLRRRVSNGLPKRLSRIANGKPLENMSRGELYELAREQEVEGRSNMSKQELVDTLSH